MTSADTFAARFAAVDGRMQEAARRERSKRDAVSGDGLTNAVSSCSQTFGITRKRDNCYSSGRTRSSEQKSNSRGSISNEREWRAHTRIHTYTHTRDGFVLRSLKRGRALVEAKFTVCRRQEVPRSSHAMTKDNGRAMRIRTDSTGKVC